MKKIQLIIAFTCLCFVTISAQGVQQYDATENILALQQAISALDDDHCEVPCGIYGDSLRIKLIKEHISTVEKAMMQITELSGEATPNYNQIIRWVNNKEIHATKIQEIVAQYFLHQRVKMPKMGDKKGRDKYVSQLTALHEVLVYSMKCKQSLDTANIGKLSNAVNAFEKVYFHSH